MSCCRKKKQKLTEQDYKEFCMSFERIFQFNDSTKRLRSSNLKEIQKWISQEVPREIIQEYTNVVLDKDLLSSGKEAKQILRRLYNICLGIYTNIKGRDISNLNLIQEWEIIED